jgi:hypothetical protein
MADNRARHTFSAVDFAEDTESERYALERLGTHRVRLGEPPIVVDLRGHEGPANASVLMVSDTFGGEQAEQLPRDLEPLGFAAAYKVLDMLVEHVLRANGATAARLSFDDKKSQIRGSAIERLPTPLDERRDIWERLTRLYGSLGTARHAVTHRRATVSATGDVHVFSNERVRQDVIRRQELGDFAASVHGAAEMTIDESTDPRRLRIIAAHLNLLGSRHRLPPLEEAAAPDDYRLLRANAEQTSDRGLRIDLRRIRDAIAQQPATAVWDVELHFGDRVFVAQWEAIPAISRDVVDVDPTALPSWLGERRAE